MSDESSENESNENNVTSEVENEPEKLPETPPANTTSASHTVKVDLGELRELLEGLPEKTAQFIKEAVATPKKAAAPKTDPKKAENAPTEPQNDTPKPAAKSKRGWLARGLFGD